jgi:hypothetical protein
LNNKYFILSLLLVLFLAARLIVLLFCGSHIIFSDNELLSGTIGKEIANGPKWPIYQYHKYSHTGGILIISFLKAAFFSIFGDSIYSNSASSLFTFSIAILVIFYLLGYNFFGKKVALFSSLLFIFSPTLFIGYSLLAKGAYYEATLLHLTAVYIFFSICIPQKKNYYIRLALLGLLSGFGVYFNYNFLFIILTFILFWRATENFSFKKAFVFICCFFAGLTPWIYFNLVSNFAGLHHKSGRPIFAYLDLNPAVWGKSVLKFLMFGPFYLFASAIQDSPGAVFSGYLYAAIFIISFFGIAWFRRKELIIFFHRTFYFGKEQLDSGYIVNFKEIFLLTYVLIYVLGFIMTGIPYDFWAQKNFTFFITIFPVVFLIIPVFFEELNTKSGFIGKILKNILLFLFLISITLLSIIHLKSASLKNFDVLAKKYCRGYSYSLLYPFRNSDIDLSGTIALINKIDANNRDYCYEALGKFLGSRYRQEDQADFIKKLAYVDSEYCQYFYEGLGYALSEKFLDKQELVGIFNKFDSRYRPFLYRSMGVYDFDKNKELRKVLNYSDRRFLEFYIRGLGEAASIKAIKYGNIELLDNNLSSKEVNAYDKRYFYEGAGEAFGFVDCGPTYEYFIEFFKKIGREYLPAFYLGLGRGVYKRYRTKSSEFFVYLSTKLEPEFISYYFAGIDKPHLK